LTPNLTSTSTAHYWQQARRLTATALLVFISACASTPPLSVPPPIEVITPPPAVSIPMPDTAVISELPDQAEINKPIVPVSPTTIETHHQSDAVIALLNTAEAAQQQGDFKSAQTTLQRAQRIAPRDPSVYYKLAVTHQNLEDYRLAEQVALKGVSIVQGQPDQLRKFWLLIASIRLQAGDVVAAERAEHTASRY
jgi:tetratricopeptide (TPR) repeat protein